MLRVTLKPPKGRHQANQRIAQYGHANPIALKATEDFRADVRRNKLMAIELLVRHQSGARIRVEFDGAQPGRLLTDRRKKRGAPGARDVG